MKFKPSKMEDVVGVFKKLDKELQNSSKKMKIKILGGASILLLGMRERVTADIDVAATGDAGEFQKICAKMGIEVDIITVASTVDLAHCASLKVFQGKSLTVESVTPTDLLKLKLERFYKQDPEDIYAVIKHEFMSFDEFKVIIKEMLPDYIGDIRQLIVSAQIVVEQMWPAHIDEFNNLLPGTHA